MMLLQSGHDLQNAILKIVGEFPSITMLKLQEKLKEMHGFNFTRQHLYKVVSRMLKGNILSKIDGSLSINNQWILTVNEFAEKALLNLALKMQQECIDFSIVEGERKDFFADSLHSLTPVWDNAKLCALDASKTDVIYQYVAHPYWIVCPQFHCNQLYKQMAERGAKARVVIGNDTFLSRYGLSRYRSKEFNRTVEAVIAPDAPFLKHGYVLHVVGDFIFECILPEKLVHNFGFFFETIDTLDRFDEQVIYDLFCLKAHCKLSMRRNKKEAASLRKMLDACFENPEKETARERRSEKMAVVQ